MKNRTRQRANRRLKHHEEKLDRVNAYGKKDLTAFNAVEQIRTHGRADIIIDTTPAPKYGKPVF